MSVAKFCIPKKSLVVSALLSASLAGCSGGGSSGTLPAASPSISQAGSSGSAVSPARNRKAKVGSVAADVGAGYPATILSDQPLAYYQLNDASASLADSGPNAISGTYGSNTARQVSSITEGGTWAAAFPGGGSYDPNGFAYTAPSATLQPANVSVEVWFKLTAANTTNHDLPIVVYGLSGKGASYGLYLHGLGSGWDSILFSQRGVSQASSLNLYGSTRLAVGKIYHVVAVSDGTNVTTYINALQDKTAPYAGAVAYPVPVVNGLNIGGSPSSNPALGSAPFGGTIAQAAIYGSALTPTQVVNHFLAGQLVPMTTEAATSADSFVDSIGVNTHFENHYSQYMTQYSQVRSMLVSSGIRHIRVGMLFNDPNYISTMQDLASAGVHGTYTTQLGFTQAQITQFPSSVSPSLEQFEAPNEQDDQPSMPNWVAPCLAFQQNLYSWVKGSPLTSQYPVLGPSLVNQASFQSLGNVSAYMDVGNMHDYFSAYNPGTLGWGSTSQYGVYGSLAYNVNLVKVTSGSKPITATETGYGTVAGDPTSLDNRAHMRYMSRLFFEQFNAGVTRSYSYELLDESGFPQFNNFGLLQPDLTPKPAYTAIKSIIGSLQDPGPSFTTAPLTYQITGFTNNVHHLLMEKRDGSYVLALWLEVQDWVTANNAGGDIIVPGQAVTLSTSQTFSAANISAMDDAGNFAASALSWSGQRGSFNVTDKVTLVSLKP